MNEKSNLLPLGSRVKDKWIFIAWVFGKEKIFENCAARLMREVTVDRHGGCCYSDRLMDEYMPHGLLGMFSLLDGNQDTRGQC
jgi:hypothetical protein